MVVVVGERAEVLIVVLLHCCVLFVTVQNWRLRPVVVVGGGGGVVGVGVGVRILLLLLLCLAGKQLAPTL